MNDTPTPAAAEANRAAAHEFLTELRTRITTQPLPYQHGVEARALESLWEIFAFARAAIKKHPGCVDFADFVTNTLNLDLRPVTAKWHRAYTEGRLNSRDGGDAFRADLATLQTKLRSVASQLHEMAYGTPADDPLAPPAMSPTEVQKLLSPVAFGIVGDQLVAGEIAAKINATELAEVKARRKQWRIKTDDGADAIGLALSGGGIRSATFCLGVVQVLAQRDLLKDVDFLSTVSGGGYAGSFLTTRLGSGQPHSDVAKPDGPDTEAIRYLRQHAKYLAAIDLKQRWSMLISALAGLLLNWTAPLLVIIIAALAGRQSLPSVHWADIVMFYGALAMVALVIYAGMIRGKRSTALGGGRFLARMSAATALASALWGLTLGYEGFKKIIEWWPSSAVLAGLVTIGPAVLRIMPVAERPAVRKLLLKVLLVLAGGVIPLGAIALFYAVWYARDNGLIATTTLVIIIALFAVIALVLLNINRTGLHRLYRDQLARTFVQPSEDDEQSIPLNGMNPGCSAPYHLINATVNLPTSTNVALRERRSDFLVFSKHWCGSPSTGYFQTSNWKMNNEAADLATAMAISGAAVSSHMGLGSMPTLRAVLTFLNVRLGFWILNATEKTWLNTPGFICLLREMTGFGMSDTHKWLNLSDGGHIENMGAYELLRRRCKFIICVDGESDPAHSFHGLMTLVRHAQIDFGVHMDPMLSDLRPDPKTGFSQTHASLSRIHYPNDGGEDSLGLFLYLKLSVTGNESELIRRYRLLNPDFPHQTTLDQFFDEEQFEAYRQLGVHVADGLFAPALLSGQTRPKHIPEWFSSLARNLLNPIAS